MLLMASSKKGQTLIEVLAAFGVAVVLVSAIAITVVTALSNATFSKNQNMATQYAQQGMEILRQMRNTDFATFNFLSGNYCLDKNNTLSPEGTGCSRNVDNTFVRKVTVEKSSSTCGSVGSSFATKATLLVSWSNSKCTAATPFCHTTQFVSCFSDFNLVPSPGTNTVPTNTPTPTLTPDPGCGGCE